MHKFNYDKLKGLKDARDECQRFIRKCDAAVDEIKYRSSCRKHTAYATAKRAAIDTGHALSAINRQR